MALAECLHKFPLNKALNFKNFKIPKMSKICTFKKFVRQNFHSKKFLIRTWWWGRRRSWFFSFRLFSFNFLTFCFRFFDNFVLFRSLFCSKIWNLEKIFRLNYSYFSCSSLELPRFFRNFLALSSSFFCFFFSLRLLSS